MTALTPDCDPDLSHVRSPTNPGGGVTSAIVLLGVLAGSVLLALADVPGGVAFAAAGVAVLCALSLTRRALRRVRAVRAAAPVGRVRPAG